MIEIKASASVQMPGYINTQIYVGNTSINLGLMNKIDFDIMIDDLTENLHNLILLSDKVN